MHGTRAVDQELRQQNGHVKANVNHVTCPSASDPGAELVQTAPAC
jgi:16S rRNA C1402 (ribose-2'-O) methylase RsmI